MGEGNFSYLFFLGEGVFKQYRRESRGSGGKREGPQSDKMAIHTITGTTTITDTAEGTGWGLQTQPPSIPGHMEGWRERVEKGGRGWVSPADL